MIEKKMDLIEECLSDNAREQMEQYNRDKFNEIQKKVENNNTKILLFKVFCLENYREQKKVTAKEALLLFSSCGVFDFLYDNFEMLHTQDTEYILDTITTYISKKK